MAIKKSSSGWIVDSQPGGRGGKRFRKTFKTQAEAKAWEAWLTTQINQDAQWAPEKRDTRKLSMLVSLWFTHHGSGLRSGEDTNKRLLAIASALGDPVADRFNVEMFAEYRTQRLKSGITANNMNREHSYMRAMFNELERLGHWTRPNPLGKLRQFKIQENELSYLTTAQIRSLLSELGKSRNVHVLPITRFALSTGARWGEAQDLTRSQIKDSHVQFARTKSGKTRAVPISKAIANELTAHHREHGEGERVFGYAWSAFREGIERAEISLPEGQLTHALRHTFASHFMINGGNILALQRILGHQSLNMTMRYAHLSPDHLEEVRRLNALTIALETTC